MCRNNEEEKRQCLTFISTGPAFERSGRRNAVVFHASGCAHCLPPLLLLQCACPSSCVHNLISFYALITHTILGPIFLLKFSTSVYLLTHILVTNYFSNSSLSSEFQANKATCLFANCSFLVLQTP